MADDQTTSTAADPPGADPDSSSTDERLTRVENAVERIEQAIGRLVPGSHADAQARTERRLDRGSDVAEQVRAELARAKDEETAAAAAATAADTERTAHCPARVGRWQVITRMTAGTRITPR